MGWTNPFVIGLIGGGCVLLLAFLLVERRVAAPLLRLDLFRIRAFAAGNLATLLAAIGRGGLNFMLVIWLQGIWLPLHGYDFVGHAALGRHLHAAADVRLPHLGSALGLPVRPVRGPARSRPAACWWRPPRSWR